MAECALSVDHWAMKRTRREAFQLSLGRHLSERGAQTRLADELGVPLTTVNSWLSTRIPDDPLQVFEIERVLDLEPGTLSRSLGYMPMDAVDVSITTPEEAIIADGSLGRDDKEVLLMMLRKLRGDP